MIHDHMISITLCHPVVLLKIQPITVRILFFVPKNFPTPKSFLTYIMTIIEKDHDRPTGNITNYIFFNKILSFFDTRLLSFAAYGLTLWIPMEKSTIEKGYG